jgi:hypothetical protein
MSARRCLPSIAGMSTTIRIALHSELSPERLLAPAYDFSDHRPEIFPAVSEEHMEVHHVADSWADVTEGTPAGVGVNWERCRYDWSKPGSVTATVTDSNVYAVPGSSWTITAAARDDGTDVEMIWVREFRHGARGRIFATAYKVIGKPIFGRYAREVLGNIEGRQAAAS